MKRYISVKHTAAGATAVTVSLVDGELAARWTVKTYIGNVAEATVTADEYARRALDGIRAGLEPRAEGSAA